MKKAIIAGAASAVLASLPAMGAFATLGNSSFTDEIVVNLSSSCSIARGIKGGADTNHANGTQNGVDDPATAAGTWTSAADKDTLTGTIAAGTLYSNYGESNFTVTCNNSDGWQVSATTGPLSGQLTNGDSIALGTPAENRTAWSYTSSSNESSTENPYTITELGTNQALVAKGTAVTGNAGRSFKVTYALSTAFDIREDTYKGTILYTLAELPVAGN